MLDGGNAGAVLIGQGGAKLDLGNVIPPGADIAIHIEIGAAKPDSSVYRCRLYHHFGASAGVNADASANNRRVQGGLILYSSQAYSPCRRVINTDEAGNLNTSIVA